MPEDRTVPETASLDTQDEETREIQREIRFAVVMYGGVSLAIYMNGISQELLNLVLANEPEGGSATSAVYRKILDAMPRPENWKKPKIVIDILSGTSAGGINAVFLAKALANGCRSLKPLEDTWILEGDIDKLLNDRGSEPRKHKSKTPKTSLLNSQRMYAKLSSAFEDMKGSGDGLVENLDLFVTATDLSGQYVPIRLEDGKVDERVHKRVFNFRKHGSRHDFTEDNNPMLAFVSRATSSFPVAFEPVKLDDIKTEVPDYASKKGNWARDFFGEMGQAGARGTKPFDERELADGGYLDNYPFGHAIDALDRRFASCPVDRKLMFIDPSPEEIPEDDATGEISFVSNAMKAAMTLPRYETIRGDIQRIQVRNRWLRRVGTIMARIEDQIRDQAGSIADRYNTLSFRESGLKEMQEVYGRAYATYHFAKVYAVTDTLARMIAVAQGISPHVGTFRAVRDLVMCWRKERYATERNGDRDTENLFLLSFDITYRLRRVQYLRMLCEVMLEQGIVIVANEKPALSENDRKALLALHPVLAGAASDLHHTLQTLCDPRDSPLLGSTLPELPDEALETILEMTREELERHFESREDSLIAATELVGRRIDEIRKWIKNGAGKGIKGTAEVGLAVEGALNALKGSLGNLRSIYKYTYELRDSMVFPLLAEGRYGEGSSVEIYRISPLDADALWSQMAHNQRSKLAGTVLGSFGAFLSREWRENDIMWGRLDGAERIVTALLPGKENESLRAGFIEDLHRAILGEYGARDTGFESVRAVLGAGDPLTSFRGHYQLDRQPSPADSLERVGRGLRIFASMIDRLDDHLPGGGLETVKKHLNRLGRVLVGLVEFSVPEGLKTKIARHWLTLVSLAGALLIVIGILFPRIGTKPAGLLLVVVSLLTLYLQEWLGDVLHKHVRSRRLRRLWRFTKTVVVGVPMVLLALILWTTFSDFDSFFALAKTALGWDKLFR